MSIDLSVPVKGNGITWSASRQGTLEWCPRQYGFNYYTANHNDRVRRLKKLSGLQLWAGNIVHDTAEQIIRGDIPVPAEGEDVKAWIKKIVNPRLVREWKESESGGRFRLREHEEGIEITQEAKENVVKIIHVSLRNLLRSKSLEQLPIAEILTVEDLIRFNVGGPQGPPAYVKMDLAIKIGDQVYIVDWKTGLKRGKTNRTQIAAYAFYAKQKGWADEAANITTRLEYLAMDDVDEKGVTSADLLKAQGQIEAATRKMRSLTIDPDNDIAIVADMPATATENQCKWCNFRSVCER